MQSDFMEEIKSYANKVGRCKYCNVPLNNDYRIIGEKRYRHAAIGNLKNIKNNMCCNVCYNFRHDK